MEGGYSEYFQCINTTGGGDNVRDKRFVLENGNIHYSRNKFPQDFIIKQAQG